MACTIQKIVRGAALRSRLLASIGSGLLVVSVLPSAVHAQIVVDKGEYYDGDGAPVTIDAGNAHAIRSTGGTIELVTHPVDLTTSGSSRHGLYATSGSKVTIGAAGITGSIATSGSSAYGINADASTVEASGLVITTSGSSAYGVQAYSSANIVLNDVALLTNGYSSYGLAASLGSSIIMNGGTITTKGMFATGVNVSQDNSHVSLTNVTVKTEDGEGVYANNGGRVTLNNSHVTAKGHAALGILNGVAIVSGSTLIAQNGASRNGYYGVDISTSGVLHMSDSWVESHGTNAYGIRQVSPDADVSTVTRSTITTYGDGGLGVFVQGNSWVSNEQAPRIAISDSTIYTYGNSAYGIGLQGIETGINAPQATVSNTRIVTEGQFSSGIAAFETSVVTGHDIAITTKGASAYGLYTGQVASQTLTNVSISTSGANAEGIRALGGSLSLTGFAIETGGDRALGVRSDDINNNGTNVALTDGSILTKGALAHGVLVAAGGRMSIEGATVETRGADAAGLYFLGANTAVHDVTVSDSSIVSRRGPGVLVRGATNTLTLNDTDIVSEGGTLFDVRRRLVPGSDPAVPDEDNPGHLAVVANGGFFKGAARPDALSTLDFTLNNGSWAVTTVAADGIDPVSDLPLNSSRVNVLTLNDSTVSFASEGGFKALRADELHGDNNLFEMNTDLGAGAGDFMSFGKAEGSHRLLVRNSGSEPTVEKLHVRLVSIDDPLTTATFRLANTGGVVDAGTYRYELVRGNEAAIGGNANDWALLNTSRFERPVGPEDLSTTANAAINTGDGGTSQSIWYAEMNALSKRLGELRLGNDEGGLWGRTFARGQKIDNRVGRGFDQTIGGLEIGLDGSVDVDGGRWYLGGVAGYSHSDRDFSFNEGKGNTDSYHVGAYATFIADNGFYFDGILKLNQMQHDYTIRTTDGMSVDGDYSNAAMGLSFETGWRFKLQDGWFLEPQAELMLYRAEGAEYRTSNGMQVRVGSADSAQLRTSMMVGRLIELSENRVIQPYVKLGWIQEFAGSSTVWTNGIAHKSKLEGGRFDLDVGIMAQLGKNHRLYADYGYASGSRLKEPWSLNAGYRYAW